MGSILIGGGVLSTQLGKHTSKDVACEASLAADPEQAVLLTDRQADDENSAIPGGAMHELKACDTTEETALEMSTADAARPCTMSDSGDAGDDVTAMLGELQRGTVVSGQTEA